MSNLEKKKNASRCGSQFINNFLNGSLEDSLQMCLFPLRVNGNNFADPLTSRLQLPSSQHFHVSNQSPTTC